MINSKKTEPVCIEYGNDFRVEMEIDGDSYRLTCLRGVHVLSTLNIPVHVSEKSVSLLFEKYGDRIGDYVANLEIINTMINETA